MKLRCDVRRYSHWWLDRCFLYVGRIAEAKGVPKILKAWLQLASELEGACPPLWLAGGTPDEIEAIRGTADIDQLSKHEAEGKVKWWGYLDHAGLSTVLLKAHVLVTHSMYEPGGRVVLEALAQGIPVIATPNGFAADLITDWQNGFLVRYGDINSLCTRMKHFALQPLLRHAMGQVAQQTAQLALQKWDFLGQHLRIYEMVVSSMTDQLSPTPSETHTPTVSGPVPRGFDGVYPFEGERIGPAQLSTFLARHLGAMDIELSLLEDNGGSRLWLAAGNGRRWVVKHAFTKYRVRPLWDCGFHGSVAELQALRVCGENLGAECNGAARIVAADSDAGLILRDWLHPAEFDAGNLQSYAGVISAFHRSTPPAARLEKARRELDRDWKAMADGAVIEALQKFESNWQRRKRPWHAWRPMSIRLAWRWLELGLRKSWLSVPDSLAGELNSVIDLQSNIAQNRETTIPFGICHGDCDLSNFRLNSRGDLVLIDCEHLHPGYFGHDWAALISSVLPDSTNKGLSQAVARACATIQPDVCPRWLLVSWLLWRTAMQICKTYALMEQQRIASVSLLWQELQGLASQTEVTR